MPSQYRVVIDISLTMLQDIIVCGPTHRTQQPFLYECFWPLVELEQLKDPSDGGLEITGPITAIQIPTPIRTVYVFGS